MELSRVLELLDYCPETGIFKWKINRGHGMAGKVIQPNQEGYVKVTIDGKRYQCHNLAWFICHGTYPENLIDHKNCDTTDNRIGNLRPATRKGNADNASKRRDNKSGIKGVSWKASHRRWVAQCQHLGKVHHLGLFDSIDEAEKVLVQFRSAHHSEFANHG